MIGRLHLTIVGKLRTIKFEGIDWLGLNTELQEVTWAIRSSSNSSSQYSPAQLFLAGI